MNDVGDGEILGSTGRWSATGPIRRGEPVAFGGSPIALLHGQNACIISRLRWMSDSAIDFKCERLDVLSSRARLISLHRHGSVRRAVD